MSNHHTTKEMLEKIETALHLRFDSDTADLVDQIRERWQKLAREKLYWQRRCGKYEKALDAFAERYSTTKMPPPKRGRGTA